MGIALTMIGLLFITRIAYGGMQMKGIVFAALAAVCYAGVLLTNRCFQEIDGLYFTFLQLLFSSGILLIYLLKMCIRDRLIHSGLDRCNTEAVSMAREIPSDMRKI